MKQKLKYRTSIFFVIVFMALISAPTIIMSVDDTVDVSCLFGLNEEEENENLKLLVHDEVFYSNSILSSSEGKKATNYTFKTYPKPHLNLISPPPELFS